MNEEDIDRRFRNYAIDDDQYDLCVEIRHAGCVYAKLLNKLCPESREKSLALTHLEEVVFWANASIARETYERLNNQPRKKDSGGEIK